MDISKKTRVCCLGDSITLMGYWVYDVNAYLSDSGSQVRFYNCGISGETVTNAPYRLADDVLWLRPEYVLVMFGANDVGQSLYQESVWRETYTEETRNERRELLFSKYARNTRITCSLLQQAGCKVILMTPPPFDCEERPGNPKEPYQGVNEELARYSREVMAIAKEYGAECIDVYTPFLEGMKTMPDVKLMADDRIHPTREGMSLIASIILEKLGFGVTIPKNREQLANLPFRHTAANDQRYDTEYIVRECAAVDWAVFPLDYPYHTWREMVAELERELLDHSTLRCRLDTAELYVKVRADCEEYRKKLILQTETIFE